MIVELFSGIHGPGHAMRQLDLGLTWGYELDGDAVATARLNGFTVDHGDLSEVDPIIEVGGGVTGLWASPPCQSFSAAGNGNGLTDARGQLVYEPLRWVKALRPEWVACEQVPEVLPIWRVMVRELEALGYSACAFLMRGEQFGLPQTRTRAMLMASRTRTVAPPAPTHQRYVSGEPARPIDGGMFNDDLLPWVSMAEALDAAGIGMPPGEQCGLRFDGTRGQGMVERHGDRPARPTGEPSPTVTAHGKDARWTFHLGATTVKLTVEQAKVLQGFPHDMPMSGSKSAQFKQIGNACPPTMAHPILKELTQ